MLRVSTALGANFTAALSLLGLNTLGTITFGVSKAEISGDAFTLYGTLDAAAVDATNAFDLGTFSGIAANPLPPGFADQARTWPYLLAQRTSGSTAGSLYATGDAATNPAVVSTAAPAGVLYSTVLTLTAFSAGGVRIGASAAMLVTDVFDVFVTEDSTVTSSTGCQWVARITGGGGTGCTSVLTKGWPYAIVQRVSGATAGNILAAGIGPITAAAGVWVNGGNAFGAPGILGTTDAQTMTIIAEGQTILTSTGALTTLGDVPASLMTVDITAAQLSLLAGAPGLTIDTNPAGPIAITAAAGGSIDIDSGTTGPITIGTGVAGAGKNVTIGNTNAATAVFVNGGTSGVSISTGTTGPITLATGTTGAVFIDSGTTGTVHVGDDAAGAGTAKNTVVGCLNVASLLTLQAGTAGVTIQPAATGPVSIKSGTSGIATFDSGSTGAVHVGDGAADHPTTVGSLTLASLLTLQGGTLGVTVQPAALGPLFLDSGTTGRIDLGIGLSAKPITIGNVTGGTSVAVNTGTGGFSVATTGAGVISLTPGATGAVVLPPRAVGAGNTTEVRFLELAASGTNYTGFKAPDALAGNTVYTLPIADGSAGQTMTTNAGAATSWTSPVKATFSAAASLTNAAAQFVPPSGLATDLALNYGVLQLPDATIGSSITKMILTFVGDAANVAGQTITTQLLLNGAPVAAAVVAGTATTAGQKTGTVTFGAVAIAAGDIITATITPSAGLTAVLTNVMVATA